MARSHKLVSELKKSRKFRNMSRKLTRRMNLEQLEDRRLMAVAPPVFILPNSGVLLNNNDVRQISPKDLTFKFTDLQSVDPTTLATGIQLIRANKDAIIGNANDITITPGFIGLGDDPREVVMRFAETLPDDVYGVRIIGSGLTPLKDTNGNPFNGGVDYSLDFRLDLGAQVIAVVPQPVTRNASGMLQQARNQIVVYFNDDDLNVASAQNPNFYRLYVTKNTLDPADDQEILPISVIYNATTDTATLTFAQAIDQLATNDGSADPGKSFRLRIGTDEARRVEVQTNQLGFSDPGSSFATALDIGGIITAGTQGSTAQYAQEIEFTAQQPYNLIWPGGNNDPGHRNIPAEDHLGGGADADPGIPTLFYNFGPVLGVIPGGVGGSQVAPNTITENQKQRAREVFELYTKYSGIQFIETTNSGILVGTGDLRAIDPTIPTGPGGVIGLADPLTQRAIMDGAEVWDDAYGANWFTTAMHEIGHVLGQGHTYDLPPGTIQGSDGVLQFTSPPVEPVFPGDNDIVHMQHMYRPDSRDIDLYKFNLDGTGVFTAEAFAERQVGQSTNLDTHLTLYKVDATGVPQLISRNDDYFSKDSYLQLTLGPGVYYVGVSASGNDKYDPTIADTGIGGTTAGSYEIKFDFRKSATNGIVDAVNPALLDNTAVAFDGDADGNPGGVYNFWFRAAAPQGEQGLGKARTLFVDKSAPAGGDGSLLFPFKNIPDAVTASLNGQVFGQPTPDIIRIVGNGGADKNLATLSDNLAYQIGFRDDASVLPDGDAFSVPKNVTVMIDSGAIFQMRRSQVIVGSSSPSIFSDRSGAALQVLGTPVQSVFFTSYNEDGPNSVGLDQNPLTGTNSPLTSGDWGGLSFKNDLDRADGRFDYEQIGVFLNYVNHADMRYGGGQVVVDSLPQVVTPINLTDSRPTVSFNTITSSAFAAMSGNPDSFEETNFQAPRYWAAVSRTTGYSPSGVAAPTPSTSFTLDYKRVGPDIHGNRLLNNTANGIFVRTSTAATGELEQLTTTARFDDTDIVHVVKENLSIRGTPGGPFLEQVGPPVSLVIPTIQAGGNFSGPALPATSRVEYKLVYVDLLGNEGIASSTLSVQLQPGSNQAIRLANLPIPSGEFVARRIYRRVVTTGIAAGEFQLVDQVPGQSTTFVDRNLPTSGLVQKLRVLSTSLERPRLDGGLSIDPSIVVKLDGARIDVEFGATLLAEGQDGSEVVFTSLADDRYGAGGTFDTRNDNSLTTPALLQAGDWGGIFFGPDSQGSIDQAVVAFGGGLSRVEGTFTGFNAIEIHQAEVRIANTEFEQNARGQGGQAQADRFGRGFNTPATIFVRGAQPVIVNNIAHDNRGLTAAPAATGREAFISINANALNSILVSDLGRQTGLIARVSGRLDNNGPLIAGNLLEANEINGMVVRGETLTTEGVWDDTDIAHVLFTTVTIVDFHSFGGLRLESSPNESLVVKSLGANAGIVATGRPLEIPDRIGGALKVLGQPGFPVVMTSLTDDTVSAGKTPSGLPQADTDGNGLGSTLPVGPEVNNGLLIDNDVATATVGHFEISPEAGGSVTPFGTSSSGVTAQGRNTLFTNANFIFEFLNYIDVGSDGGAVQLGGVGSTITMPPTLMSDDLVISEGTIAGANGPITWRVETRMDDGISIVNNTLTLSSTAPLGNLRFINYLDEDILSPSDDLLYKAGSPGQPNFRLLTLDGPERIGFSQGGIYQAGPGLVNATYDGFAADRYSLLQAAILGAGTTYSPTGNINLVNLPTMTDPQLGTVNGPGDVTTAMAWSVNPLATTATITSFLELVPANPVNAGAPGEWRGITLDKYSHDRNVASVLETESPTGDGTANSIPGKAQFIGSLAASEKGGDENLRLGFTINGLINRPSDVDIYSFKATAGTEVWIDIDRTAQALDAVVELIDSQSGIVIARSQNSPAEAAGGAGLFGTALVQQKTVPYEGQDFYTTNPYDPGMRVVLHGPVGSVSTYAVRVRSNSGVSITPIVQGNSGTVTEVVRGAPNSAVELLRGGGPTFGTVIQGASGSVAEIVKGSSANATEIVEGGTIVLATTIPGGFGVNEQQTLSFTTPPTAGTFSLTFNGQTTAAIPFNATAAQLQAALETLSNITAGDVAVTLAAGTYTITFQGTYAGVNVPAISGIINEIQRITPANPGSEFTLTFDGQRTGIIPGNATAAEVQAALLTLNNLSAGDVLVTGVAGGPWDVQFSSVYSNQNVFAIQINDREVQRVSLTGTPTGGSFTLSVNATTTAAIPYNANANQVQTALRANLGNNNVDVTGNVGGPWDVTFRGTLGAMDIAPMTIAVNEIQSFLLPGTPTGGTYRLTFGADTTTPIAYNANAATILAALGALPSIGGAANVSVATGFPDGHVEVTFQGTLANQDVAALTGSSNDFQRITAPVAGAGLTLAFNGQVTALIPAGSSAATVQTALENLNNIAPGDIVVTGAAGGPYDVQFIGPSFVNTNVPEISILASQIMPANATVVATTVQGNSGQNERQTVTVNGNPVGGAFRLSYLGQQTALIPYNATAAQIQAALTALPNIGAGNVQVTLVGTIDQGNAATVEFIGALQRVNIAQLVPSTNEFQRILAPAAGTTLSLGFGGQTTTGLLPNATAAQVQAALQALSTIGPGNVVVTGPVGGPYDVEFTGSLGGTDVAAISIGQDEIQRITVPTGSNTATFTLTFNGQTTTPILLNASAATVQAALQTLSSIGAGNVSVTSTVAGTWDIRFTGALGQRDVTPIVVNINEVQRVSLPGNASGGTFTLTFFGLSTSAIPYNASAALVQSALEQLSSIGSGNVLVTGSAGGPYEVTFRGTRANTNVPTLVANADALVGGLTQGSYQLQLRLREVDEFGGSTIRFADIRNAVNGISVLGLPIHSPLVGENSETTAANNLSAQAQRLGNLLASDRGAISVSGNITSAADIDWFSMDIQYGSTQGIPGVSTSEDWWATVFDIDYADGLARPNMVIYVFDAAGNLVLTSRDSGVSDDQTNPINPTNVSDLGRGSSGTSDPYIGPAELPSGTYLIAVAGDSQIPTVLNQYTQAAAAQVGVRLEPVNSVRRIVEDHIEFQGGSTALAPVVPVFIDNESVIPWFLGDVTLFVGQEAFRANQNNESSNLVTVNPFTGQPMVNVNGNGGFAFDIGDIAFRNDNQLFSYSLDTDDSRGNPPSLKDSESGNFLQINTGTGAVTNLGDDGIGTFEIDPASQPPMFNSILSHIANNVRYGYGIQFNALTFADFSDNVPANVGQRLLAVGDRGEEYLAIPNVNSFLDYRKNILYQMDINTGAALVPGSARLGAPIFPNNNGAATDRVEVGEIVTSSQLRTVDATVTTNNGTVTVANILDGTTFAVDDGTGIVTFEFDAGPEYRQSIPLSGNPLTNPGNPHLFDGDFFILDRDADFTNANEVLYQFDTGVAINVLQPAGAFLDGQGFVVTDNLGRPLNFEIDDDGKLNNATAKVVNTKGLTTNVQIATAITNAINTATAATFSTTAQLFGSRVVLSNEQSVNRGSVTGFVLEGSGGTAPILQAVADVGGALEGQTFTIQGTGIPNQVFEFSQDAVLVTPGAIRVNYTANATATQIATAITAAVNSAVPAGLGITGKLIAGTNRVLVNGEGVSFIGGTSPVTDLIQTYTALGAFFQISTSTVNQLLPVAQVNSLPVEENSTAQIVGAAAAIIVNNAGGSPFTMGADAQRINFAPFTTPVGKVPTQQADTSGIPVWISQGTTTGTSAPENIAIPFLAEDQAVSPFVALPAVTPPSVGDRIANAINSVFQPTGLVATASGSTVRLNTGRITVPANSPFTAVGGGPGGTVTGIAELDDVLYAVSDQGGLYRVNINLRNNSNIVDTNAAKWSQVQTTFITTSETDLNGINFQGLTVGPQSVENGRYANMLFAIDDGGRLYAFDTNGQLQPVFNDGATSVATGVTDARGLAFSALDDNLFHATPDLPATSERQADNGHGINAAFDRSRGASPGGSSIHLGLGSNGNINFPGGAAGSVVSNEFDLTGYSSLDQPVMYFNYYANTQQASHLLGTPGAMLDAFRVFVGGDDGNWQLVATNNSARGGGAFDDEFDYGTTFGAPQVQELYDNNQWRQVRVDLGAFAGQSNLRVRFDYSAAGSMNLGDNNTTGDELRAVSAAKIQDGNTFVIDATTFEFDSGFSLVLNSGNSYANGETFTVDGITFGFNSPGVPGVVNVPINNTAPNISTPQQVRQSVQNVIAAALGGPLFRVVTIGDNVLNIPDALTATENLAVNNFLIGNAGVAAGNVRIPFQRDWNRIQVADSMNLVLESTFYNQAIVMRGAGNAPFRGTNIADSNTFTITPIGGGTPVVFEFDSGYVVNVPTLGGNPNGAVANRVIDNSAGGNADGFQIVVNGVTTRFEFDSEPGVVPTLLGTGHIAVKFTDGSSQLAIANAMVTAINNAGLGITAKTLSGSRVQIDTTGNTTVVYTGGQWSSAVGGPGAPGFGNQIVANTKYTAVGNANPLLPGVIQVRYEPNSNFKASDVATRIAAAINASPLAALPQAITAVIAPGSAGRVQLNGPDVTFVSTVAGLQLELPAGTGNDTIKQHEDLLRIIGHDVVNAGPLALSNSLEGDVFGGFNSPLRGQANAFEGIYIDDIVIGFAERGEMATSFTPAANTTFTANPLASATDITVGPYQLEIRQGVEVGIPNPFPPPDLLLLNSYDTNDRLTRGLQLTTPAGAFIADGATFTLTDGVNRINFEFNDTTIPNAQFPFVTPGNQQIDFTPSDTSATIAKSVRNAINSVPVQAVLKLTAQVGDGTSGLAGTSNRVNVVGPATLVNAGPLTGTTFGQVLGAFAYQTNQPVGDKNRFRDQGQIILQANTVRNSSNYGILVDNGARTAADGNAPHPAPVQTLTQPNTQKLIPGVVIDNNVLFNNRVGGILFSGDTGADASVPFGRIVNNTLYGLGGTLAPSNTVDTGIRVEQNASPTLLNNIVANFRQGVNVDATSNTSVLGGMVFQGNTTNSNVGVGGDFPYILQNTDPLFVNASAGNFYLKKGSQAIDSAVDSLLDRAALVTVRNPMGIPQSNILAPDYDNAGQFRKDDPSDGSAPKGTGLNPLKDRGAIDRVDFTGPTSRLVNPEDNDAAGVDLDLAATVVVLQNQIVRDFSIALFDRNDPNSPPEGSDIDDLTVDSSKVILSATTGGVTTVLREGVDYSFSYDATNNIIRLTPLGGLWPLSTTYRIDISNDPVTGIFDRAGNVLQPNHNDGLHYFTIFLGSAVDWGDAPNTYLTLSTNNGPSHQIVGGFNLGSSISADVDGQPSATADLDTQDDGLVSTLLQPTGTPNSSNIVVNSSATARLDAWLDLDKNGMFDVGEKILDNVALAIGDNTYTLTLPSGLRGNTILRLRMSSVGGLAPTGPADDGEVEDHLVTLVGPQFQNPSGLFPDVNNDGFVAPIDVLLVVNYLQTLGNGALLPNAQLPSPIVPNASPPPANLFRYLDVDGDGVLSPSDQLAVVNYLNAHPIGTFSGPNGEGEGEGEPTSSFSTVVTPATASVSTTSADSSATAANFPGVLYASSSVVVERLGDAAARTTDDVFADDFAAEFGSVGIAQSSVEDSLASYLPLVDSGKVKTGPLDEEAWDDLLGEIAVDLKVFGPEGDA